MVIEGYPFGNPNMQSITATFYQIDFINKGKAPPQYHDTIVNVEDVVRTNNCVTRYAAPFKVWKAATSIERQIPNVSQRPQNPLIHHSCERLYWNTNHKELAGLVRIIYRPILPRRSWLNVITLRINVNVHLSHDDAYRGWSSEKSAWWWCAG